MSVSFKREVWVGEPLIRNLDFLQGFSLKYNLLAKTEWSDPQILVFCSSLITYYAPQLTLLQPHWPPYNFSNMTGSF